MPLDWGPVMWLLLLPAAFADTAQLLVTGTWGAGPTGVRGGVEVALQMAPGAIGGSIKPVYGGAIQVLGKNGTLSGAVTLRGGAAMGIFNAYGPFGPTHGVGLSAEFEIGVSSFGPIPALRTGGVFTAGSPIGGPVTHVGPRLDVRAGEPLVPEVFFGGGLQALLPIPMIGSPGRPLRIAGRPTLFAALGHPGPALEAARAEWASVPAFLHLAAELDALGARDLATRARAAAVDEVRHAVAQLDAPALMEVVRVPAVRSGTRDTRIARIAWESLVDGVIGEADAAQRVQDETIASEERMHAALAGEIVSWARRESAVARAVT